MSVFFLFFFLRLKHLFKISAGPNHTRVKAVLNWAFRALLTYVPQQNWKRGQPRLRATTRGPSGSPLVPLGLSKRYGRKWQTIAKLPPGRHNPLNPLEKPGRSALPKATPNLKKASPKPHTIKNNMIPNLESKLSHISLDNPNMTHVSQTHVSYCHV